MDTKTKAQRVNALMTKFVKLYEDKYGVGPKFNRHTEKWGFDYMLEDLGIEAVPTLEYYFTLKRSHNSKDLLSNYHDINAWRIEDEEDAVRRRLLAQETKKRVEKWEAEWGQKPSA